MRFPYMSWRQAILKSDLPATTRHVLLTLGCHMNDAGESCYPSIALLVEETGLSNRSVVTHLGIAEDRGWISREKHGYAGRRWARNEYRIEWPGNGDEVVQEVHHLNQRGSEPNDNEVVQEVHTNSPVNSPVLITNVINPPRTSLKSETPKQTNIAFDAEQGIFVNVHGKQMAVWEEAFPKLDLDAELTRAEVWYAANPRKRKKNHQRFLVNWLARAHTRMTTPQPRFKKQQPGQQPTGR